jgi:hypothetical protein
MGASFNEQKIIASGNSSFAMGSNVKATAHNSHACGSNAIAAHANSFCWSDGTIFTTEASNQFAIHASGNVIIRGGDLDMGCNDVVNVERLEANVLGAKSGDLDLNANVTVSGNVSVCGNLLTDIIASKSGGAVPVVFNSNVSVNSRVLATEFGGSLVNTTQLNAGNVDVTGDVTVGGNVLGDTIGKHTGPVCGDVTGNVTGNLLGDSYGTHTGPVVGDVTGNVIGDSYGKHYGNVCGNLIGDSFVDGNICANVVLTSKLMEKVNGAGIDVYGDLRVMGGDTTVVQFTLETDGGQDNGTLDWRRSDGVLTGRIDYPRARETFRFYTNGTASGPRVEIENNGMLKANFGACIMQPALKETTPSTDANDADGSLTAAELLGGIITRSGLAAPRTDTLDTAANIVSAIWPSPSVGQVPEVGCTLQFSVINTSGQSVTLAAGTGGSTAGNLTVAAGVSGLFAVRLDNVTTSSEAYTLYRLA